MIIDTHCHAGINWFAPVEMLVHQMDLYGVSHAVLVQHTGSYDNSYLFECAQRYKDRFKVAALLDVHDKSKMKVLESLHKQGAAGLRMLMKHDLDPNEPVWKEAGNLGMVISVIGSTAQFASADFKKLLDNCPKTQFCLEHLARAGKAGKEFDKPPYDGFKAAMECAKWPNASIKIPGFGEIVERPATLPRAYPFDQFPPLFDMVKEAFGVQRMMFASDFPPNSAREGYLNVLNGVRKYPAFQQGDDLDWILRKSAAKVWGFPG
jgi:predicted TIM-barrel fold metal-dependent hydrolase